MISTIHIQKLLEEEIADNDLFLVDIQSNGETGFTVFIDGLKNVTLKQCADLSTFLRSKLGESYDELDITVSSPGLDSPFKHPNQYIKNLNEMVEIVLKDGNKLMGKLLAYTPEHISIQLYIMPKGKSKSRKSLPDETINIDTTLIKHTKKQVIF